MKHGIIQEVESIVNPQDITGIRMEWNRKGASVSLKVLWQGKEIGQFTYFQSDADTFDEMIDEAIEGFLLGVQAVMKRKDRREGEIKPCQ